MISSILVMGGGGVYVIQAYRHETGYFTANSHRDVTAENTSGRQWARPVDVMGVPNCHKVSDDLYRGGQPTAEGMRELEKLGIKTIVSFRSLHSDSEEIQGTSLEYEHIRMYPWDPEDEQIIRFLKIVSDKNRTPVFVHCMHGSDRTGTVCAVYRIVMQGWGKQEAVDEMLKGGFGFHMAWQNLIGYIAALDIDAITGQAGGG
ncbi:MAG: tyrosine-protein phosphatase [Sedimentisphaerales bacterium]|nr:tyrosine-protein phosphatase [Sedimentisphaerales bacterium]